MKFSGEQLVIGKSEKRIEEDHLARYEFIKDFVADKVVLDAACGTGYGTKMIKDFGAKGVFGVDISEEAIKYAEINYAAEGVKFITGSVAAMDFKNNSFDVIVSFETIEHLNDETRQKYLNELRRLLKTDGLLIISTPNRWVVSPNSSKPINQYHFIEYNYFEFKQLLETNNFKIIKILGQRMIYDFFLSKLVMKFVILLEILFRIKFHIYDIANGAKVMEMLKFHQPRYFIFVCKSS